MSALKEMPRLLAALRKREDEMVRLLGRFVKRESPSDVKSAVDDFGKLVAAEWQRRGARLTRIRQAKRGNHLRLEWPGRTPAPRRGQLLVLGHLDTVYEVGALRQMPFRVARGRASGPGTFDMKGGLVIALFAADALAAASWLPKRRVVFLWTSDEEIGSKTSRALIEREARRSAAVLVLEPASGLDGRLKTRRKGIGTAELLVTGRATHAGLDPEKGINAIREAALQIDKLERLNQPGRGINVNSTVIAGGTRENVIPANARVVVDLRAETVADMREVESHLHALRPVLRGAKIEVRGGFSRPPLEHEASAKLFREARHLAESMGLPLEEASAGGGSDGNFTAAIGVPTLDGLGAVGEGAHSQDENIVVRALPERAALLAGLLATL
jgi:glutamate carboxypeptidase